MVTNLAYFYESARKVRGGKFVWVKDSNGEDRRNILLGGTILNPNKGLGHLWAAQLMQYKPNEGVYIFRSFAIKTAQASSDATEYVINGDGFSDAPEVGMVVMVAPDALTVETLEANTETGAVTKTVADYTGQSAKITAVVYDAANEKFTITVDNTLGALDAGAILVEATGTAKSASAKPLVPKPNIWNEADRDLLPTDGSYGFENANYSASGVYDKQAYIARMQPLPKYVLALNKSLIDGIFWI
jgi:asparagine N-glycosylation enzyme membrane subunit Stt3